ncbi:MAG: hypothetical protein HDS59_05080 [Barnesiella sp.]|nr:hypothetical protein [Barnesiella sp.]
MGKNGEQPIKLPIRSHPVITYESSEFDKTSNINIQNCYQFECKSKDYSPSDEVKQYIAACNLIDTLNDLIEEYHAPGNTRRERRATKHEFEKVLRIFLKHCKKYNIAYSVQNR